MKKILLLLLSVFVLSCGQKEKESEVLIMGTYPMLPPFVYQDPSNTNNIIGFDVEIAKEIAKTRGKKLEIRPMLFHELIPAVQNGEIDMAVSIISVTPERREIINFSIPYYEASQAILIRKDDEESFASISTKEQLGRNKKIATLIGSTGETATRAIADSHNIIEIETYAEGVEEMLAGNADVMVMDAWPAKMLIEEHPELTLASHIAFDVEYYCVAVNKNRREFLASINETISRLVNSGRYIELVDEYITSYTPAQ